MTLRNPLVFVPGGTPVIQELPAGDSIGGSTPGSVGAQGPTGSQGSQGTQGNTGSAGSNGVMAQISQVITSGSAATIHFASIPGSYSNLKIVFQGRDTATGSSDLSISLKINSDNTAANYTVTGYLLGNAAAASSGTVASSTAGGTIIYCPGTSGNAAAIGYGEITIANYAGTTFQKIVHSVSFESQGATPSNFNAARGFVWKSTAAITDLVLTAGGTAFVNGTTATLYGF